MYKNGFGIKWLIYHKTKPNQTEPNQANPLLSMQLTYSTAQTDWAGYIWSIPIK